MEGEELVDDGPVSGVGVLSTGVISPRLLEAGIFPEEFAGPID